MVANVIVYLDDNELEFMDAAIRCGYIVSEDDSGEANFHFDLLDSSGYHHLGELIRDVAGIFQISQDNVLVSA